MAGELYVVLFNNGKGSCATAGGGNATMTVTWAEVGLPPECMGEDSGIVGRSDVRSRHYLTF